MFHQVNICEEDQPAQWFLWRGMERNCEPDVMQMTVMTFGSICSRCSAQFVESHNAAEFIKEFQEVLRQSMRVIMWMIINIHSHEGFHICSWTCSSKDVLKEIPPELLTNISDVHLGSKVPTEHVLCLHWNTMHLAHHAHVHVKAEVQKD